MQQRGIPVPDALCSIAPRKAFVFGAEDLVSDRWISSVETFLDVPTDQRLLRIDGPGTPRKSGNPPRLRQPPPFVTSTCHCLSQKPPERARLTQRAVWVHVPQGRCSSSKL